MSAAQKSTTTRIVRLDMCHLAVCTHVPNLDSVIVISSQLSPNLNQFLSCWLHVSRFVDTSRTQGGGLPVPNPGLLESCESHGQRWFLKLSVLPSNSAIGGGLHPRYTSTS